MKVILLVDVAKLGRRNEVVDVPQGYGLNKLIPSGQALPATPENLKKLSMNLEQKAEEKALVDEKFKKAVEKLGDDPVEVRVEANENNHLFAALSAEVLLKVLKEKGVEVQTSQIHIKTPIKEVGEHEVYLINGNEEVALKLQVVAK